MPQIKIDNYYRVTPTLPLRTESDSVELREKNHSRVSSFFELLKKWNLYTIFFKGFPVNIRVFYRYGILYRS